MPSICQTTDNTRCFKVTVQGKSMTFTEHDTIHYQGKTYTGADFYALYAN